MAKYNIGDQPYYGEDENGNGILYEKDTVLELPNDKPPSVTWTALDAPAAKNIAAMKAHQAAVMKWKRDPSPTKGDRPALPSMFARPSPATEPAFVAEPDTLSGIQAKQRPQHTR